MLVRAYTGAIMGVKALRITVEVSVTQGIRFFIVGLADGAIRESQQRIESAILQSGFSWPHFRIVINLSPADLRKDGTHYDLPLGMGILAASEQLDPTRLRDYVLVGELSLDGTILPVRGVLPMAIMARDKGFRGIIVPVGNFPEAEVVDGLEVIPVSSLKAVAEFFEGVPPLQFPPTDIRGEPPSGKVSGLDFSDIKGQDSMKQAMLFAAAGGHSVLLHGAPGSGKSMAAHRLATILPPMNKEEALHTTMVYSVAGLVDSGDGLLDQRPLRSPHHTASNISLIGGGASPRPGEISLAHNGILFLDELPEFRRNTLEVLRQPLEDHKIHISRAGYRVVYPADFILVASMNPCPCGYYRTGGKECTCSHGDIRRYRSRLSGPLLDRIDMKVSVSPVESGELSVKGQGMSSSDMREQVMKARLIQQKRFAGVPHISCNARMSAVERNRYCSLDPAGSRQLELAMINLTLSARSFDRIRMLARTIADIEESELIRSNHVSMAIYFQRLEK